MFHAFGQIQLGKVAGIPIRLNRSLLWFLPVIALLSSAGAGLAGFAETLVLIAFVFGFVLLHELGHAMAARHFGVRTRDITLYPLGGIASLERMPRRPLAEIVIALAGPAVNVVLAAAFALVNAVIPTALVATLVSINLGLALFNMIPAFPLDGGRVLRALLALRLTYPKATQIAGRVGQGFAGVFALAGFVLFHPILILIAVFLYFAAGAEIRQVAAGRGPEPRARTGESARRARASWFGEGGVRPAGQVRPPRAPRGRQSDVIIEVGSDGVVRTYRR